MVAGKCKKVRGKVYGCSLSNARFLPDKVIKLVCTLKKIDTEANNLHHFPKLAPSELLFNYAQECKKRGESYWEDYAPKFEEQLSSNESQLALYYICEMLDFGFDVAIVCFCDDASICHRSLILKVLSERGYEIEELNING